MNQIAIINEAGLILELFEDQNLVIEQAVAWLSDDELPPEISYPIDCPLNDHNKKFVSYGYRVDAALPKQVIPVTVQLEGVLYKRAQFAFKVQNGKLNGYLKIDSAEVYDKLRKLTLLELFVEPIRLGTGTMDAVNGSVKNLATRMKEIAEMPIGQYPFTFFPIRNELFYEDDLDQAKLPGFSRQTYVNVWQLLPIGGHGFHVDGGFVNGEKGFTASPQFFLWWVLNKIMERAGYRIESSWLASDEIQRLVIVNMTAMSQYKGTLLTDPVGVLQGHRVTPGMHLPDMNVSDFLKAVKGRFGLVFSFDANRKICYMERFVDVLQMGSSIDLTQFQTGNYDTGEADGKGYSVEEFVDENDELYKDAKGNVIRTPPFVIGQGVTSIALKAGTCQMIYETSPLFGSGKWLVPTVRQAGNTVDKTYKASERYLNDQGKRKNDIGLKFLSYRGMTQNSNGSPYPLATADVRDGRQVIAGSQALALVGRFGAWRSYLRQYYYFRTNTQPVNVPLLVPVTVLSRLERHRLVSLSLEDQIMRNYLITKLQSDIPGIDGKAIVRLSALTIPSGIDQPVDVDDPIVWVEWIAGPVQTVNLPQSPGHGAGEYKYFRSYTVKFYQDQNKTIPASVSNLPLNVRKKHTTYYNGGTSQERSTYAESLLTYYVSGQDQVLEAQYITILKLIVLNVSGDVSDGYVSALQLDPGEGYNILT
jgi:hypothetical protein